MSSVIVYTVVPSAFILSPPSVIYAIAEITTIKMIKIRHPYFFRMFSLF